MEKNNMTTSIKATISINKKNLVYSIRNDKNIVQSSIEEGIKLPYSCRSGVCGTCKVKLTKGKISKENSINYVLTEKDRKNNIFLEKKTVLRSQTTFFKKLKKLEFNHLHYKSFKKVGARWG